MIFKLMYLINLNVLNLMVCIIFEFAYKLQLYYNMYRLVFIIWTITIKIIKMKIPLGSCKLYAKRNIPLESAK